MYLARLNTGYFAFARTVVIASCLFLLAACGDGEGSIDSTSTAGPITAAPASLSFDIKTFRFTWTDVPYARFYKLLENPDGVSGFSQVGSDIAQGAQTIAHIVPLYKRLNASYILQSCNTMGCTDSETINISGTLVDAIGYIKASNSGQYDLFGYSVSLSGDGHTLAVGADSETSNATGINGDQADNSAERAGAVYVFTRNGITWSQQAYIKASNTDRYDYFGSSVSLSGDGNTLAVGAIGEKSKANGIDGGQADNSRLRAGAVYVFTRNGTTWSQQAYVKASNSGPEDYFGSSVSLSGDGHTLAVGAYGEKSNATGIDGDQADNSIKGAGAVYVFTRSDTTWSQQAYVKASNTGGYDNFGSSVSLSGDGNTLAVGAGGGNSATGPDDCYPFDDAVKGTGAVYVFTRNGTTWSQQASKSNGYDHFGFSVSLSGDGNTLAVGASCEDSNATGIDGDQDNNSRVWSGAVYVFTRNGSSWSQQAYVKASNTDPEDHFGFSVSLSGDGHTLAVGTRYEASNATGINGDQADNSAYRAGAVYVFTRNGITWSQQAYVKASNTDPEDNFGYSVSLSSDGNTLAVGTRNEASKANGIDGDQANNSVWAAGAVYLY